MTSATPDPASREPAAAAPDASLGARPSERPYEEVLADAIRVLTEAARLARPVLARGEAPNGSAGQPVWVESGKREPADWAEFVSLALAGAAANAGGISAVLAGRSGSWEAGYVRNLLRSTVGPDEERLLDHRTEPVVVEVHVDEMMLDLGVWQAYDDAQQELDRRYAAIGIPTASTPEAAARLAAATPEQDRRAEELAALEQRLEEQRVQDWTAYGQALAASIQLAGARRPGLRVPVVVRVDLDTFPVPDPGDGRDTSDIVDELRAEGIEATALPGGGRPPLERLEAPAPTTGPGPQEER